MREQGKNDCLRDYKKAQKGRGITRRTDGHVCESARVIDRHSQVSFAGHPIQSSCSWPWQTLP